MKPTQSVLCVDLDGTLIKTDLLIESALVMLKHRPLLVFLLPYWLFKGKAHLKNEVAKRTTLDASVLPYHEEFLKYLKRQHAEGKSLILASASNYQLVKKVADHVRLFDTVIASDARQNYAGTKKLKAIRETIGSIPFSYAGNSMADLPIWYAAESVIIVNPDPGVIKRISHSNSSIKVIDDRTSKSMFAYLLALRPHQWLKNLLVFVPILMAHKIFEGGLFWEAMLAFVTFCLCASSVYLLNDMLDLPDDRRHPKKCKRPFASGNISLMYGMVMAPVLLAVAIGISMLLPTIFTVTVITYYFLTLLYSLCLKRLVIVDLLVLAILYSIRIIAGGAATAITPSFWLLAFSMFLFLSLALAKRYAELNSLPHSGVNAVPGRGYCGDDTEALGQFGTASGYMAVLVLAMYVDSSAVVSLYRHPEIIWLLCPILLYLIMRIWLLARRGELHEDPVLFLIEDRLSQILCGFGLVLLWLAV